MSENHNQKFKYSTIDNIKKQYGIPDSDIVGYLLTHGTFANKESSDNLATLQINKIIESLYKSRIIPKEIKDGLINKESVKTEEQNSNYDVLDSLIKQISISYDDFHNYILTKGRYFEDDPIDFTYITMILNVNTLYNEQIIPEEIRGIWVHRVPDNRIKEEEGKDKGISK